LAALANGTLGGLGDHARPHRGFSSDEYCEQQEDQDDADEHHPYPFDGLVDHRRKRNHETYSYEQPQGDVAVEILVEAESVGDRRGRAGHPSWEEVGQNRPVDDDSKTQKPLGRGPLCSELT
jgi:hypothetical protein